MSFSFFITSFFTSAMCAFKLASMANSAAPDASATTGRYAMQRQLHGSTTVDAACTQRHTHSHCHTTTPSRADGAGARRTHTGAAASTRRPIEPTRTCVRAGLCDGLLMRGERRGVGVHNRLQPLYLLLDAWPRGRRPSTCARRLHAAFRPVIILVSGAFLGAVVAAGASRVRGS
jgi:hypothetical protein